MVNSVLSLFNDPFLWWLSIAPDIPPGQDGLGVFLISCIWAVVGMLVNFMIAWVIPLSILFALIKVVSTRSADPGLCLDTAVAACGFIGNSDIYGLGVCLGVYLQWLSFSSPVTYFLGKETELCPLIWLT
jgi:hypothetical protein